MSANIDFAPSGIHQRATELRTQIFLPQTIDAVFGFFADAGNLESITPPWLGFQIESPTPIAMAAGRLIDYRLKLHHIPIRWRTEISIWEPPFRFVDRQVRGPYLLWEHTHQFIGSDAGTRVIDSVHFRVPGGSVVENLLVRPDLKRIFQYRHDQLSRILLTEPFQPTVA